MKPCPQCSSTECDDYSCRFTGLTHEETRCPPPIRVRGILFRDVDDAHDHFEQQEIDGE